VGPYPLEVPGLDCRTDFAEEAHAASETQFRVVRHLMQSQPWDYLQFVDTGLDRLLRGFSEHGDPVSGVRGTGKLDLDRVSHYFRHIDMEIGKVLELIEDETVVLVVSPHRPQSLDLAPRVLDRGVSSERGAFILAGPIRTLGGEIEGVRLLDLAPTLLDLGGHEIPQTMQGRSLVEPCALEHSNASSTELDEERLVRERLSGLGYV